MVCTINPVGSVPLAGLGNLATNRGKCADVFVTQTIELDEFQGLRLGMPRTGCFPVGISEIL